MRRFLTLTDSQRKNVYESIAHKANLPAQVIEKDFWVTAVLQTVFSLPIAEHIVFKGGTSLSKGWNVTEWQMLGTTFSKGTVGSDFKHFVRRKQECNSLSEPTFLNSGNSSKNIGIGDL